jgi:hypothetical protein
MRLTSTAKVGFQHVKMKIAPMNSASALSVVLLALLKKGWPATASAHHITSGNIRGTFGEHSGNIQ